MVRGTLLEAGSASGCSLSLAHLVVPTAAPLGVSPLVARRHGRGIRVWVVVVAGVIIVIVGPSHVVAPLTAVRTSTELAFLVLVRGLRSVVLGNRLCGFLKLLCVLKLRQ